MTEDPIAQNYVKCGLSDDMSFEVWSTHMRASLINYDLLFTRYEVEEMINSLHHAFGNCVKENLESVPDPFFQTSCVMDLSDVDSQSEDEIDPEYLYSQADDIEDSQSDDIEDEYTREE
jgi:hypothetical protein